MAKDMAGRYLRRMPLLSGKGQPLSAICLATGCVPHFRALKELQEKVSRTQEQLRIPDAHGEPSASKFAHSGAIRRQSRQDVELCMSCVMMHRFDVRRRRSGPTLFEMEDDSDDGPSVAVAANPSVYEAARFQLFRHYDRPYYFGIDDLCDASSENAELFLQLSAQLVEAVATQIARTSRRL